jgi:adenosine kinase
VRETALHHTARFIGTTDSDMNQIASFYPGAMSEDVDIDLSDLVGAADLVLIGASDPEAMLRFTPQCRQLGLPFAADTSWQLARLDGDQVRELVEGAAYLFSNEYEAELIEHKTGWSSEELTGQVGIRVTTLGSAGARVERSGEEAVLVPPVPDAVPREPTGAGDAFRSGFLAAVSWGLSLERAAQLGNMLAVHALETTGTQEYVLKSEELTSRLTTAYGAAAAQEIAVHLG